MIFNKSLFRYLWIIVLAISIYLVINLFRVESSILKLLPKYQSADTNALITKATESINKQLVIMAESEHKSLLISEFEKQLQAIEKEQYIAKVEFKIQPERIEKIYQSLIKYKSNLMSHQDLQTMANESSVEYMLFQAQEYLYGVHQLNQSQMELDPLFLFQKYISKLSQLNVMEFAVDESYFMVETAGLYRMTAFIELTDSAFSPKNQLNVINSLDKIKYQLSQNDINLYSFGAVRFANHAYQSAKHEISTVGLGSLVGIVLLMLLVFRSVVPLILSITSIGLGLILSMSICLMVFKEIHVFALVFGATIAGVSIDYCFHYLVEASFSKNQNTINNRTFNVKQIFPGLLIGFLSSALVYLGFLTTGYEVLGQISLFSVLGLLSVLLNVVIFFPWIYRAKAFKYSGLLLKLTTLILHNPLQSIVRKPWVAVSILLVLMLVNFVVVKPNDDVRALQHLSPQLKQEEAYIREVLSWHATNDFILIKDKNLDGLLQQEAEVLDFLRIEDQTLVGVSDFIPSEQRQFINYQIIQTLYAAEEIKMFLDDIQITHNDQQEFQAINLDILNEPEFKALFKQRLLGQVNGFHALIIPLKNKVELPSKSKAVLIQQAEDTSQLFAEFRVKSTWVLAIAVVLLIIMLGLFRYPWFKSIHMVSLPLMAGIMALMLAGILGFHVSLFSVLALLLVLGMGLDYVVFLKESHYPEHVMLALLLSSITTILAFGLLAFSEVPVLQSFGFMVGVGIALVLLMSPAVVDWNEKK